jgi:mycothiol synthase
VALFAAAGYEQARWFHFMSRDLAGAVPGGQLPEGTRIAGYAAELSPAARQVRDEAFGDHWGATQTTGCSSRMSTTPSGRQPAAASATSPPSA